MIDPANTVRNILERLSTETQEPHQEALATNEAAIRQVRNFAVDVTKAAMAHATRQGADMGTAMVVGTESSTVAVLLLGVEYGRILERDQVRSLEDILADMGGE